MIAHIETDPETGELLFTIPPNLIAELGWKEGTLLQWIDNQDGSFILKEKPNETSTSERSNSAQDL